MTYREKLQKEHPERVSDGQWVGGCMGCPYDYGYCEKKDCLCEDGVKNPFTEEKCTKCWDQEMSKEPLSKKLEKVMDSLAKFTKTIEEFGKALNEFTVKIPKMVPASVIFKDGHEEAITHSWYENLDFITFVTSSGVYIYDHHSTTYYHYYKVRTWVNSYGNVQISHDVAFIDHIELKEAEVDD